LETPILTLEPPAAFSLTAQATEEAARAMAAWIEQTWLAMWVRESAWGFPLALILHAVGMGFVAGFHFAAGARLLGFAPSIRPAVFNKLLPVLWLNLILIVVSGLMLLSAFPAQVLTNAVFYVKLALIVVALFFTWALCRDCAAGVRLESGGTPAKTKFVALASIVFWIAIIVAGRLLAYTHNRFV
jgi:hypothetical protein